MSSQYDRWTELYRHHIAGHDSTSLYKVAFVHSNGTKRFKYQLVSPGVPSAWVSKTEGMQAVDRARRQTTILDLIERKTEESTG